MCERTGATLHQHTDTEGAQLGGDFRDNGDTGFQGSGFRQDTDDDGHANLSPRR